MTPRTIWNAKSALKLAELGGKDILEVLFTRMQESGWVYETQYGNQDSLEGLFMAHPGSIGLARKFHHIAVLDSTYKTNKYSFPLLQVDGITSANKTFTIGLVLMAREVDSFYTWAMEYFKRLVWSPDESPKLFVSDREKAVAKALTSIFPSAAHHLCIWHIEKNVVSECKKSFESGETEDWTDFMSRWKNVVRSTSEGEFEENLRVLRESLSDREGVMDYLDRNILPLKHQFVEAWMGDVPHFGSQSSQRVEASHSLLKKFLDRRATANVLELWQAVKKLVEDQLAQIHASLDEDPIKSLVGLPKELQPLTFQISLTGVKMCKDQFDQFKRNHDGLPCTNGTRGRLGIPCSHEIGDLLVGQGLILPEDFHPHWIIDYKSDFVVGFFG